ncbi:hypothetical protein [Leptospira santarosai]|uniref:hypothetical protein n=1 Tax=Leptospira santarosai TaxID=28183 RepID=UPI0015C39AD9|nr:hypothetical protein [Leptospira santarosai]MBW9231874.1 hypothetical protein [Leptospira santarosai]
MIRTKGNEEIPKAIRKQLDTLLKTGGEGIDVGYLMYIQDKPEKHTYENSTVSLFKKFE